MTTWTLALVALLLSVSTQGFDINGTKWPGATTHFLTGIPGISPSGIPWSQALRDAAQEWNDSTDFKFEISSSYRDPCIGYRRSSSGENFPTGDGDGLNGADFTASVCGNNYGTNVLAVALVFTESNQLGAWDITEADVVFNSSKTFDIYDGPINGSTTSTDFTRVALHELGHVIGMGHSNTTLSIMRPTIGSLFALQKDDIDGANQLYRGYANCVFSTLDFGLRSGSLADVDCTVKQLMAGGTDCSFVDVYQITLQQELTVTADLSSSAFDPVLVLMDSQSAVLELDDDSGAGSNSRIRRTLPAGTYALLANTFTSTQNSTCVSSAGAYQLGLAYESTLLPKVGRKTSFLGGTTSAVFSGGVSTNNGVSYANNVRSTQEFDVVGRIELPVEHHNKPGFIVVAAVLEDGEILVKHPVNGFVPLTSQSTAIPITTSKILGTMETVDILSNAVAAQMGITQISVGFLIGYGLNENPGELYFHSEPISLVVTP